MIGIGRVLGVWVLVAVLMIANGIFRETVLVRVGSRAIADVASAALGIAIVLGATRPFLHSRQSTTAGLLWISAMWLVMTIAFEFGFGHYVDHKSWSALVENYAIWRGRLWPVVLATFVATPFIWTARG